MPDRSEAIASGIVRGTIDFHRCGWIRPLVSDYIDRFETVASLFPGNPADPAAWRDTIARVQSSARNRRLITDILIDQLSKRRAPAEALEGAKSIADPSSVAIVTGQQAGLFGGPFYTVLKAVTAIQLARRVERQHGVKAVPVFWVDSEDHDWEELRTAVCLDRDLDLQEITLRSVEGAGTRPVGSLLLDGGIDDALAALDKSLDSTEFREEVVTALRRRYYAGASVGAAFAGLIDDLLGRYGLVVFDATDGRAKPAVADLFSRELQTPTRTSQLVREAGTAMRTLGHQPQVEPSEDTVNLFYLDSSGRRPIKVRGRNYLIGDLARSAT